MISRTKLLMVPVVAVLALLLSLPAYAISGLTFNPTAQLSLGNTDATMTGLVTCAPTDASLSIFAQIVQGQGSRFTSGFGFTNVTCPVGGGTTSWTDVVSTSQGQTFKTGQASAFVSASSATQFVNVAGNIKLSN